MAIDIDRLIDAESVERSIIYLFKEFGPMCQDSLYWRLFEKYGKHFIFYRTLKSPRCTEIHNQFQKMKKDNILNYNSNKNVFYLKSQESIVDNSSYILKEMYYKHTLSSYELGDKMVLLDEQY